MIQLKLIIIVALWFILIILHILNIDKNIKMLITAIAIFIIFILTLSINIHPIEVYRGNTSLKIIEERVDNKIIKRDSIVVLKNNIL